MKGWVGGDVDCGEAHGCVDKIGAGVFQKLLLVNELQIKYFNCLQDRAEPIVRSLIACE